MSSLPENQQSSYEILRSAKECDIVENIMAYRLTAVATHVSAPSQVLSPFVQFPYADNTVIDRLCKVFKSLFLHDDLEKSKQINRYKYD